MTNRNTARGVQPVEFNLGAVVWLKKAHPCGGYEWQVVRLGADIGIRCSKCGRRVLIERGVLERRVKRLAPAQNKPD